MTHTKKWLPWLLSVVLCLAVLASVAAVSVQSSANRGSKTTTTSKKSTTRSTTTKIGKTKYDDLLIMEQKDGTYWACNKKTKEKTDYTGVAPTLSNGYWYCRKGKVDKTYTGVGKNPFGLWMVVKGKVDLTYDGYWVRNGIEIYRIQDGAVSLYTTVMNLEIPDGVYKDGSKKANEIMNLTEPIFQENISNAAEQGVVRTHAMTTFKKVLLVAFALTFFGYLFWRTLKERKEDE